MSKKSFEFSAKTIEEAISMGLEELGVAISDVTVDILQEGSKGLFGLFGSRLAKVKLTLNNDEEDVELAKELVSQMMRDDQEEDKPVEKKSVEKKAEKKPAEKKPVEKKAEKKPAEKKAEEKKTAEKKTAEKKTPEKKAEKKPAEPKVIVPAEQADRTTAAGKAQEFLQELTKLMGVNVSVAVTTDEEGNVKVNMEGDTLGILIGRRGETLDALQYLTSLQVNKGQNDYTRVTLDTENYRAKREEALVRLANRMANRAQKTGRKVAMEPMNPYERRILHSALQNNPNVSTHSEGEEPNRHVVITLK
ncbi:MAG: protein jag [Clostridia bacterium]|nr:protein jag [Clostridia bacterium]